MSLYLTAAEFKLQSILPAIYIDEIEDRESGWVERRIRRHSSWIDARLIKRYAVPFVAPYPDVVIEWCEALTSLDVLMRRGIDSADEQFDVVRKRAEQAQADVLQAADAETGLFELPLTASSAASGVSKGGPYVYSSSGPYTSFDEQRAIARDEDAQRKGTSNV
jgi:hypothetical protein